MQSGFPRLLADVGGTNARWAFQVSAGVAPAHVRSFECADFASLGDAARYYLDQLALPPPQALALGVATPVTGDAVRFVNNPWSFSQTALKSELSLGELLVLNDFAALAMALPKLGDADRQPLGGASAVDGAPIVVMGPGTGLGVAALLTQDDGRRLVVSGEGGHATLAAANDLEADVLKLLRQRFGHVSAERLLSGPGLTNLNMALGDLLGRAVPPLQPAEVVARAQAGSDPHCRQVIDLFVDLLAGFAGNLVLSYGARGGLYLGGGIVPRLGALIDTARFRRRFEDKGRFAGYLQPVPGWIITAPNPALLGLCQALDQTRPA